MVRFVISTRYWHSCFITPSLHISAVRLRTSILPFEWLVGDQDRVWQTSCAFSYFGVVFDAYYALVISVITFAYLYLTIRMARWRAVREERWRTYPVAEAPSSSSFGCGGGGTLAIIVSREEVVKNDSLTSYERVKYFNWQRNKKTTQITQTVLKRAWQIPDSLGDDFGYDSDVFRRRFGVNSTSMSRDLADAREKVRVRLLVIWWTWS
jgi:hypothetical protein